MLLIEDGTRPRTGRVAELYQPVADEHRIGVVLQVPSSVALRGDRDLQFCELENLIESALESRRCLAELWFSLLRCSLTRLSCCRGHSTRHCAPQNQSRCCNAATVALGHMSGRLHAMVSGLALLPRLLGYVTLKLASRITASIAEFAYVFCMDSWQQDVVRFD
ncbi:hypothetical protein BCAR13_440147 [Paraburkholderia caribensis]|nr:hypothetical protein BCAR13_440147 [Paraburkholderia caribensis]